MIYIVLMCSLIIFVNYLINNFVRFRNRRLSNESRYSSYGGVVKNRKEVRPLTEKDFQQAAIYKV